MECSGSVGSGMFQSLSGNGQVMVTCGPYQSWYLVSFLDRHMEGVCCLSDVFLCNEFHASILFRIGTH